MSPTARPRISIDGYNLALEKGTGVATYARNLSFALRDLGCDVGILYGGSAPASRDPLMREVAFFDTEPLKIPKWTRTLRELRGNVAALLGLRAARIPVTGKVIVETYRSRLPYFDQIWNARDLFVASYAFFDLFKRHLDVSMPGGTPEIMHWTYPLPIRVKGARNIYTMHDLVPLRLPYTTLDAKRRYFRMCQMLIRDADHIVTVSEASRRDIIGLLGVPEDRVTNTYQTVEIPARHAARPLDMVRGDIEGTFGLTMGNYFLFFGAIEPKKNVGRLIEAYLASGVTGPLVIAGKKAWKSEDELKLLFDDHIRYLVADGPYTFTRHRVVHLDYVSFPLLVSLIRGARAVLFPSLYEGFGLPALEAMLLGTPVMTSNTASLPEVVGDAALTVDPYDTRAMAEAIRRLDTDAQLRARLAAMGPGQAAKFDSAAYRKRLTSLYGRLGIGFAA
ncbi:glycosyltransferase [Roseomonas sp. NAR14]|uniref:Glycosyltransferase n=1 Tax=Roseomonas acroporae TaxID=2937791 RepID=A0A9X2BUC3_9PROT|nr:glycosyltransferase [Roseomonas acroporae]MCK8783911.1 glycosyltransferase [Roseomonas acroporae]